MAKIPAAIIFINADQNLTSISTITNQLQIDETIFNKELNARLLIDPNYPLQIHLSGLRLLVILPNYHQTVSYQPFIPNQNAINPISSTTIPNVPTSSHPNISGCRPFYQQNNFFNTAVKQNWFPPLNFSDGYSFCEENEHCNGAYTPDGYYHCYPDGYNPNALPQNIIHEELADIIIFFKQGQATILKNNFVRREDNFCDGSNNNNYGWTNNHRNRYKNETHQIIPINKLNIFNLVNSGKNYSYPMSCRKCDTMKDCHCFDHLPLPIRRMLIAPWDPSGVHTANCDIEYLNKPFIFRR
jgi:hypothetical protein